MKILVPTDFSIPSKKAAKYATFLALTLNAKLIIFHAVPQHSIWLEKEEQKMLDSAQKKLDHFVASLKKETGGKIEMETLVINRFPLNDVVNDMVSKMKIDFIVMGTKGVTGATNKLIGGFASGMIRHCKVPVIAVPESSKKKSISNIVLPTDLINMKDEIRTVAKFAKWFNSIIHVLYVPEKSAIKSLPLNFKKSGSYANIQFHELPGKNPEVVIEKFIAEKNADLLAIFTRKRNFFARLFNPSLTESLSYDISIPLFAFKKE